MGHALRLSLGTLSIAAIITTICEIISDAARNRKSCIGCALFLVVLVLKSCISFLTKFTTVSRVFSGFSVFLTL